MSHSRQARSEETSSPVEQRGQTGPNPTHHPHVMPTPPAKPTSRPTPTAQSEHTSKQEATKTPITPTIPVTSPNSNPAVESKTSVNNPLSNLAEPSQEFRDGYSSEQHSCQPPPELPPKEPPPPEPPPAEQILTAKTSQGAVQPVTTETPKSLAALTAAQSHNSEQHSFHPARTTNCNKASRENGHIKLLSAQANNCLLYTSPSPRDLSTSRMPSSA